MRAAEEAAPAAAAAAPPAHIRKRGGNSMGDSTGSMFYAFGAFLIIYLVGALIYTAYLHIKKRRDRKKDEQFRQGDEK